MSLKYRPFAVVGFTVLLSLFFLMYFTDLALPFLFGIGAILFVLSLVIRRMREAVVPLFLSFALIYAGCLYVVSDIDGPKASEQYFDTVAEIKGVIIDNPTYSGTRYYYLVDLDEINGNPISSKLRLSLPVELDTEPYDEISLKANLYEISPDSDEIKMYYHSKGVFIGGYVFESDDLVINITKSNSHYFNKFVFKVKEHIISNINNRMPGENGATVVAMLLGDKSYLSDERNESFREAGIAPIFAVSGLHLSVWVLGLFTLLKSLGIKRRFNSIVSIAFTLFFMVLTGLTPSVCRAGIMMILLLVGNLFYRKTDSVNSLGFVALLLCTINPYTAIDTGFLLSFSATLGIVTIVPACNKYIFSKIPDSPSGDFLRKGLTLVTVSIAASIAVLPFTILLIGHISVFSVVSNVLLSYAATFCMVLGGLGAMLNSVPVVSDILFVSADFLSGIILKVVDTICSFPLTVISTDNLFWKIGAVCFVGVIAVGVFNFKGKNVFKFICVALTLVISILSITGYFYFDGLTQVRILNVGNGISAVCYSNGEKIALTGKADDFLKTSKIEDNLNYFNLNPNNLLLIGDDEALSDSSNFILIKNLEFNRIVLPYADQSIENIVEKDTIFPATDALVEVFDDDSIKYHCDDEYSIALCNFDGLSVLFLFESSKKASIPQEYLSADCLVCCGYIPQSMKPESFKRVIICAEEDKAMPVYEYAVSRGANAQMISDLDGIVINIRDDSCDFYVMEG